MGYRLGVDLGTTYTAAAVHVDGRAEMLGLGIRAMQVPSVVFVSDDGEILVGEAADSRGGRSRRVVREFKRRIGDSVPIMVGGSPFSAQALIGALLAWVVGVATDGRAGRRSTSPSPTRRTGGRSSATCCGQAVEIAGLRGRTSTLHRARGRGDRLRGARPGRRGRPVGSTTWAAARSTPPCCPRGSRVPAARAAGGDRAPGRDRLRRGGVPARADVAGRTRSPDSDDTDPATATGLARLRRDCVEAKEVLSFSSTRCRVALPGSAAVRLTRGEFEDMLRPAIGETVAACAGSTRPTHRRGRVGDVLVGGSSRIPLVSEMLSAAFGRPVALDAHPKHDVALGAAIRGTQAAQPRGRVGQPPPSSRRSVGPGSRTAGCRLQVPLPGAAPRLRVSGCRRRVGAGRRRAGRPAPAWAPAAGPRSGAAERGYGAAGPANPSPPSPARRPPGPAPAPAALRTRRPASPTGARPRPSAPPRPAPRRPARGAGRPHPHALDGRIRPAPRPRARQRDRRRAGRDGRRPAHPRRVGAHARRRPPPRRARRRPRRPPPRRRSSRGRRSPWRTM